MPGVPEGGFKTLTTVDKEPGHGPAAKLGDIAVVLYYGKLTDGTMFDSNMDEQFKPNVEKDPYSVILGVTEVIQGWHEGLVGAKEGMIRTINIPYTKAYGSAGRPPEIPGKSDLIFTMKILKVFKAGVAPSIEAEDVKTGTGPKVTMASTIKFSYKGMFLTGRVFDEQEDLSSPVAKLIPGFKDAIMGMQAGGTRKISWPPGSPNPTGQIPPGQPLEYVIEVKSVQ